MIGGGTGPADGTSATTVTPGAWNIQRMLESADGFPVNLGFLEKAIALHCVPWRNSGSRCFGPEDTRGLGIDTGSHQRSAGSRG
jgi:hypothetical protein